MMLSGLFPGQHGRQGSSWGWTHPGHVGPPGDSLNSVPMKQTLASALSDLLSNLVFTLSSPPTSLPATACWVHALTLPSSWQGGGGSWTLGGAEKPPPSQTVIGGCSSRASSEELPCRHFRGWGQSSTAPGVIQPGPAESLGNLPN